MVSSHRTQQSFHRKAGSVANRARWETWCCTNLRKTTRRTFATVRASPGHPVRLPLLLAIDDHKGAASSPWRYLGWLQVNRCPSSDKTFSSDTDIFNNTIAEQRLFLQMNPAACEWPHKAGAVKRQPKEINRLCKTALPYYVNAFRIQAVLELATILTG
eukprot:2392321-Amphidinium_carterae.1